MVYDQPFFILRNSIVNRNLEENTLALGTDSRISTKKSFTPKLLILILLASKLYFLRGMDLRSRLMEISNSSIHNLQSCEST